MDCPPLPTVLDGKQGSFRHKSNQPPSVVVPAAAAVTVVMNFGDIWGYSRSHSDIASEVSSDASSFVGPYLGQQQGQQQELTWTDGNSGYLEVKMVTSNEEKTIDETVETQEDWENDADDEVGMSSVEKDESLITFTNVSTTTNGTSTFLGGVNASALCHSMKSVARKLSHRNIVGKRRQRAKAIHNSAKPKATSPTLSSSWPYMDRLQLDCIGLNSRDGDGDEETARVIVEVREFCSFIRTMQRSHFSYSLFIITFQQASAICDMDWMIHRQSSPLDCDLMGAAGAASGNYVPGSNFVGVVQQTTPRSNESNSDHLLEEEQKSSDVGILAAGTRVAAIVPGGGANAKFISVPTRRLCVVPKKLDAAEICAILSTYLPAFSALHHGRSRPHRYSRTCLRGRTVLITGCTSLEAQAAVRMAEIAGCSHVHVTAPREYFSILHKHRPTILGEDPDEWLPNVEGKMDVVLDYQFPKEFPAVRAALARKGRLVCVPTSGFRHAGTERQEEHEHVNAACCLPYEFLLEYCYLVSMKRATLFNFADVIGESMDENARQDLDFLLHLLSTRQLRPDIDRYIGLK